MRDRIPMTQTLNATTVRQAWSQLLNKVYRRETRVIVEKSGIPVAALVSLEDLERLQRYEEQRAKDFAILDEMGTAFKDVPPEDLEREVAKALAEVRAEHRRQEPSGPTP